MSHRGPVTWPRLTIFVNRIRDASYLIRVGLLSVWETQSHSLGSIFMAHVDHPMKADNSALIATCFWCGVAPRGVCFAAAPV